MLLEPVLARLLRLDRLGHLLRLDRVGVEPVGQSLGRARHVRRRSLRPRVLPPDDAARHRSGGRGGGTTASRRELHPRRVVGGLSGSHGRLLRLGLGLAVAPGAVQLNQVLGLLEHLVLLARAIALFAAVGDVLAAGLQPLAQLGLDGLEHALGLCDRKVRLLDDLLARQVPAERGTHVGQETAQTSLKVVSRTRSCAGR